mmetsp:Transcript_39511/g.104274  ORF Transcript_39511/g.104274 Transcript_39511/m.104274 type:complete len:309 (-) Transcript_39511:1302-2228(-)
MPRNRQAEDVPLLQEIHREAYEDTPAYEVLKNAGVLETKYRRSTIDDIFTGADVKANTSQSDNLWKRLMSLYYCGGCCIYNCTHIETFVPAGHVGFLMNEKNEYLFMQPGMHNIASFFMKQSRTPQALRGHITHGNRTIVIVEQGYLGYAQDNGQPVLLPPGIHVWKSESLYFIKPVALDDHIVDLGPMTLVTVDEGYAAVTQNNGKQVVLPGGNTHLLKHKNHKFESARVPCISRTWPAQACDKGMHLFARGNLLFVMRHATLFLWKCIPRLLRHSHLAHFAGSVCRIHHAQDPDRRARKNPGNQCG